MTPILTWITVAVAAVVVALLAGYLIAVAVALTRAHRSLARLAGGLEAIAGHTEPLPAQLTTINGALASLLGGLRSVDGHLTGIGRLFF